MSQSIDLVETEYIRFRIRSCSTTVGWAFCLFFLVHLPACEGKPQGARVICGEAAIEEHGVRTGCNAILEWDSFSIGERESFEFIQPKSSSSVLNRVIGGAGSEIFGSLRSNGRVYLINKNGVLIGPNAQVVSAGFIASSLDVLDREFLQDQDLCFEGDIGSVINLGTIEAPNGDVALIGRVVRNEGVISAPNGTAFLGVGTRILIRPAGEQRMFVDAGQGEMQPEGVGIANIGLIEGLTVEIKAGKSLYQKAIHSLGKVDAVQIAERGGRIYLESNNTTIVSGSISANSDTGMGGEIRVLGDEVHIYGESVINASGKDEGGTVLIGGNFQGQDSNVRNARRLWVGDGAQIAASASEYGNGGKVILWSNDVTQYYGHIQTKGGLVGGNGGFIEVSGGYLDFQGTADFNAPFGKSGEILLDPSDITISTGTDSGGSFSTCPSASYTPSSASCVINTTTLENLLNTATCGSVTISTSGGSGGTGVITVASPVSWSTTTTLVLVADVTVAINANISNTSTSTGFTAMNFTAHGTGSNGEAGVWVGAASSSILSTTGGDIILVGTGNIGSSNGASGVYFGSSSATGTVSVSQTGNVHITGTGAADVHSNQCGISHYNGYIYSVDGSVTLIGQGGGGNTTVINSFGVANPHLSATGNGSITIQGTGGGVGDGVGVFLGWPIALVNGNLSITGTGSANIAGSAYSAGITFNSPSIAITGTGAMTLTGIGGGAASATTGGYGMWMASGTISAGSGGISMTGLGHGIGSSHGIYLQAATIVCSSSGSLSLNGTASGSATAIANGVEFAGTTCTTASGSITIIGTAPPGGTTASYGVHFGSVLPTSTSGSITVTGISLVAQSGSYGVLLATSWSPLTTGTVSFVNCVGTNTGTGHGVNIASAFTGAGPIAFSSCTGGTGGSNGVNIGAAVTTTSGSISATGLLGQGPGGSGFASRFNVSTANGAVSISGSANGTSGACHGISLTAGTVSATGSISLSGSSGASSTASYGINIASTNAVATTTGSISISGTSSASAADSYGVYIGAPWATGTSGTVTFTSCTGGSGANSDAIYVGSAFSTGGAITATSAIVGGSGSGSSGFHMNANFATSGTASAITIAARSDDTTGAASGILLSGGSMSTAGGAITLTGIGGVSSGAAHGINITGGASTITTAVGNGTITLIGIASGTGVSYGVNIAGSAANVINSSTGNISVSGTSAASGTASHGVSLTNSWTTGTGGTVTFSNCTGGSGAGSYGVNIGAAFTTTGNVVAISGIQGGSGNGGIGFNISANMQSSNAISITATGAGGATGGHGIAISGGTLSTSGGTVGTPIITLIGTASSASTGSSHGVYITSTGQINVSSGDVLVSGSVPLQSSGTTASYGVLFDGSIDAINSTAGNIYVSGVSQAAIANSYGVYV